MPRQIRVVAYSALACGGVIGALLGATVGYLTPFWIKHAA